MYLVHYLTFVSWWFFCFFSTTQCFVCSLFSISSYALNSQYIFVMCSNFFQFTRFALAGIKWIAVIHLNFFSNLHGRFGCATFYFFLFSRISFNVSSILQPKKKRVFFDFFWFDKQNTLTQTNEHFENFFWEQINKFKSWWMRYYKLNNWICLDSHLQIVQQ